MISDQTQLSQGQIRLHSGHMKLRPNPIGIGSDQSTADRVYIRLDQTDLKFIRFNANNIRCIWIQIRLDNTNESELDHIRSDQNQNKSDEIRM